MVEQMQVRLIDDTEFSALFDKREFNPPGERTPEVEEEFENEFGVALSVVDAYCREEFSVIPDGEDYAYSLHEYYNWSRVISVEFSSFDYLREDKVAKLQAALTRLPKKWTVILDFTETLFVSPDEVLAHVTSPEFIEGVDLTWIDGSLIAGRPLRPPA